MEGINAQPSMQPTRIYRPTIWSLRALLSGLIAALIIYALLASGACVVPVAVRVNANGTFSPSTINIKAGQSIEWSGLGKTDSIVQIGNLSQFPDSDPCGFADNDLDHAFAASDENEFTGPTRKAVSGIFALGPEGSGFVQKPSTESCNCESEDQACVPTQVDALDGNSYKLCPGEGATMGTLDSTWTNPDLTGVIIRIYWSDIQIDNQGVIEFHWDDLDREMNKAVANGKLFTLDVRAGKAGTPSWIFTDYQGSAPAGPVTPIQLKDWADGAPPEKNCGFDFKLGSPMHTAYRDLYVAMLNGLAAHVATDSRWFQALAHVKVSGANLISSEARLPKRCYDGDGDGILDTIGHDECLCNPKIWANEGNYTPAGLYEYYRVIGNTIYNAFFQRKSLGFQLIQAGFPRVESATNFEGDSLRDQDGNDLLSPPGVTADDPGGTIQTETILQEGRDGRFVDPFGAGSDATAGMLFVPQHSGLAALPNDADASQTCSQAVPVDPGTQKAVFPIVTGTTADRKTDGCPNRWAVEEGTIYSHIMGFQTQNPDKLEGIPGVESALWNLTINSNGVFIELYEEPLWEILQTCGTGSTAAVLDAHRLTLVSNPAPYSKNLFTWTEELHARRKALVDPANPNTQNPFPTFYTHTFSKVLTAPETYYYINPAKCGSTSDPARVGQITVNP